jgi:hypothetical protein
MQPLPASLIDAVLPNLLLSSRAVCTRTKNRLHLIHASEQDLPCDEPSDALVARRRRQATLVRPKLVEILHRL